MVQTEHTYRIPSPPHLSSPSSIPSSALSHPLSSIPSHSFVFCVDRPSVVPSLQPVSLLSLLICYLRQADAKVTSVSCSRLPDVHSISLFNQLNPILVSRSTFQILLVPAHFAIPLWFFQLLLEALPNGNVSQHSFSDQFLPFFRPFVWRLSAQLHRRHPVF